MTNPEETTFTLMFVIGTAGMLLLATAIVIFVIFYQKRILMERLKHQKLESGYQRQMLEASIASQENERKRIASDLHDEVGSILSAIKINMAFVATSLKDRPQEGETLDDTKAMIDEAINSVRRISKDLLPATLEQFGLDEALMELCNKLSMPGQVTVQYSGQPFDSPLDKAKRLSLYRIGQELLNNALKHAKASEIHVALRHDDGRLALSVEDNGLGFDYAELEGKNPADRGVGIFNLQSRASVLNGVLDFKKGLHGRGTKATITIDLSNT